MFQMKKFQFHVLAVLFVTLTSAVYIAVCEHIKKLCALRYNSALAQGHIPHCAHHPHNHHTNQSSNDSHIPHHQCPQTQETSGQHPKDLAKSSPP